MKYPYIVKHNGEFYPAGAEVPVEEKKAEEKVPEVVTQPIEEEKATPSTEQKPGKPKK